MAQKRLCDISEFYKFCPGDIELSFVLTSPAYLIGIPSSIISAVIALHTCPDSICLNFISSFLILFIFVTARILLIFFIASVYNFPFVASRGSVFLILIFTSHFCLFIFRKKKCYKYNFTCLWTNLY